MTTTLERLSTCENFQMWEFGAVEKALTDRQDMTERMKAADPTYVQRWGEDVVPEDGPWVREPDKVQWIDPTTGLDCLILRNRMGALCGYVGVAFGHPFFGRDYGECSLAQKCDEEYCDHSIDSRLSVHGGITFTDFCAKSEEPENICHVPAPGRPDEVWWFGFDTAHAWDLVIGMSMPSFNDGTTYKDVAYVVNEIEELAVQLKAQESGAEV